jgi:hypothetical protein
MPPFAFFICALFICFFVLFVISSSFRLSALVCVPTAGDYTRGKSNSSASRGDGAIPHICQKQFPILLRAQLLAAIDDLAPEAKGEAGAEGVKAG